MEAKILIIMQEIEDLSIFQKYFFLKKGDKLKA